MGKKNKANNDENDVVTANAPVRLVIFDLDGVLVDSKGIHYEALNSALNAVDSAYVISSGEHLRLFDGLTTKRKLQILTEKKGLDSSKYEEIWQYKQQETVRLLKDSLHRDEEMCNYFARLHERGYKIAVASNSIRATIELILSRLGLLELVDYYAGNEDVLRKKPHPEIYWKCMAELNAIPEHTAILEDSYVGQKGASDSKCHLIPVTSRAGVHQGTIDLIEGTLHQAPRLNPWRSTKLNVLIPMAGKGSRFVTQDYSFPKPLIMVQDKSMIQAVVDNLNIEANFIFIVQEEHYMQYHLDRFLPLISPGCKIVQTSGLTEGAACTTLLAKEYINTDDALLIANSDQIIKWNSSEIMYTFSNDNSDGSIITFKSIHPKWSYAKLGEDGYVSEVAEKLVISEHATAGIYFWKRGSDYIKYAEQMIAKDKRTNNEFYVCPVFNEAIEAGLKIRIKALDPDSMWSLGTPEDLAFFLNSYKGEV